MRICVRWLGSGARAFDAAVLLATVVIAPFAPMYGTQATNDGREYVYGPDYVDEFVAQVDRYGATTYFLQDANYNVVALLDEWGHVLEQYTWEPYGEPAAIDRTTAGHPNNRVGHQGLFFERLDATSVEDTWPLKPGAFGFYHNRNRTYLPSYGRFMQPDPSEAALLLMDAGFSGDAPLMPPIGLRGQDLYGDSANLYQYLQSNPVRLHDPTGCFTFGDVLSSMAIGVRYYGYYDTIRTTADHIKALAEGASLRNVMLTMLVDMAANYTAGKLLDFVVDVGGPVMRRVGAQIGHGADNLKIEKHHPWPKHLGGPGKQTLADLGHDIHVKFHKKLIANLRKAGFDLHSNSSTEQWLHLLEQPGKRDKMFQVLVLTSKEMDEELGGCAISEALMDTLRENGINIVDIMSRLGTEI